MTSNTQMFQVLNSVIHDDGISEEIRLLQLIDWINHYERLERFERLEEANKY